MSSTCIKEDPSIINSIEKSKSDNFDCLIKILPNGLKALLVSDPDLEISSAALGVNVGSLYDKPDELGIAHFCEHLLFMGTDKYPSENEWNDYITKNGGLDNAYTDIDKTVYYFKIKNEALEGALDRFAQFFISPRFNKDSVDREINAINSENNKNINNDLWRLNRFFKSQLNSQSPFSQFTTGNKETLAYNDIRERLIKWYNKYYSSDIMTLCIYSNMKLEDQILLLEKYFKNIPKKEKYESPINNGIKPYDENNMSNFFKVIPIKNEEKIVFKWLFPFCPNYNAKPLYYFSSLFGHEGPNTLTSYLKKENLITSLVTSSNDYAKIFSDFTIDITLTNKGFENYKNVIYMVLKYIYIIKEKKINERYFNEVKNMKKIKFDFRNKIKPFDFSKKYVKNLMYYKPEDVFTGEELYKEFDENLMREYLNMFNLNNLNICFLSQKFEKECTNIEKYYGIKYFKEKLNIKKEEIDKYNYTGGIFDYPPENNFVPKNLNIYPIPVTNSENIKKYPELILDSENCKGFFLQDNEFKLPKGMIKFRIYFIKNLCNNSDIKNHIIAHLLKKIIKLELNEILYMAEECDVKFKLKIFYDKLELIISGFNDSLKSGLQEFLTKIQTIELNPLKHKELLSILKEEYIKKIKNYFLRLSYKVNIDYMKILLVSGELNPKDLLDFLLNEEINLDDLINFKKNMFIDTKSFWLIQGNFEKSTAIDIINNTNEIFKININKKILKPFYAKRVVELNPEINYIYRYLNPNKEEKDSTIFGIYQFGNLKNEEIQYFNILYNFLSEKFYDTLRTKETLGYIVTLFKYKSFDILHLIGIIQSSIKEPEFCSERIRAFFKEKENDIKNITEENFNSIVNSLYVEETRKDIDLKEQFDRNWSEIALRRNKFNIKEENAKFLKKCTKEGFIEFYDKYIKKNMKKIDLEYVCEKHWEDNEKKLNEEINWDNNNYEGIRKKLVFNKISDFQDCNKLYPSFNSKFYRDFNE